jgi:hypothetical protein
LKNQVSIPFSLGESQNYHRPIEEELLEDYLNAVDLLTINEENRLKTKIFELIEKQDELSIMNLKICRAFDLFIVEPCNTLTSHDGYTLTKQGNKVLACFAGGAVGIASGRFDLLSLGLSIGCGGSSGSSPTDVASVLAGILGK